MKDEEVNKILEENGLGNFKVAPQHKFDHDRSGLTVSPSLEELKKKDKNVIHDEAGNIIGIQG